MDFFNTRMCFGKFWEQQKKFWDTKIFVWNFSQKVYISRGGGVNANLEKVYILDFFFGPFPNEPTGHPHRPQGQINDLIRWPYPCT